MAYPLIVIPCTLLLNYFDAIFMGLHVPRIRVAGILLGIRLLLSSV